MISFTMIYKKIHENEKKTRKTFVNKKKGFIFASAINNEVDLKKFLTRNKKY